MIVPFVPRKPEPLDLQERAHARRVQIDLGARKVCTTCGASKPVAQFAAYGARACTACEEQAATRARQAKVDEARRLAAELERAQASVEPINDTAECACGMSKPRQLQRCRWCQGRLRAGLVTVA